jgi:hypothetical protein
MKFWTIKSTGYRSDYRHSYVNGELDYPFGLPGIHCDICGETWGSSRVLSYECPESLRSHKNLTNGWAVPWIEGSSARRYNSKCSRRLAKRASHLLAFRPGDSFQPCYLEVPSRPRADFLWHRSECSWSLSG